MEQNPIGSDGEGLPDELEDSCVVSEKNDGQWTCIKILRHVREAGYHVGPLVYHREPTR